MRRFGVPPARARSISARLSCVQTEQLRGNVLALLEVEAAPCLHDRQDAVHALEDERQISALFCLGQHSKGGAGCSLELGVQTFELLLPCAGPAVLLRVSRTLLDLLDH